MGKTLKKLGRGLATGLIVGGGIAQQKKADEEEKRRFDEQSARAERQLQMQEAESAARLEKNKLDMSIKRVKHNNQKMAAVGLESRFNPEAMGPAFNKFGTNQGSHWTFDAGASAKATAEKQKRTGNTDPNENVIIYRVGAALLNDDGTRQMGPDGKAVITDMPGSFSQQRFENQGDHVNFFVKASAPEHSLAAELSQATANDLYANAQKVHDQRMKSDPAYALKYGTEEELAGLTIKGKKANIAKTQAETRKLDRGVATKQTPAQAPVSEFMGATGQPVKQTAKDVEKAKQFANSWNKTGAGLENPIDADDAARMMHMKNSKGAQSIVKKYATAVANGSMSEGEFKEKFADSQLPQAFVDSMYNKIEIIPIEEIKKPGIFSRTWNKIFN